MQKLFGPAYFKHFIAIDKSKALILLSSCIFRGQYIYWKIFTPKIFGTVVFNSKRLWQLTLSMLDKTFSRGHFEIVFLIFPENRLWHFNISCKLSPKIGLIVYANCCLWRQFTSVYKVYFLKIKNKKNKSICCLLYWPIECICLCWGFTAQSNQWGHVERCQFT